MTKTSELLKKCTTFDMKMMEAAASAKVKSLEGSRKALRGLVDFLPQREAIQEKHLVRWIDRTLETSLETAKLEGIEGEAQTIDWVHNHAMWHLRRASAIGGSEVGTVVNHFRGLPGTFTDARNLTLEKLLILAPQPSTPEMARGVRAEPWIQRMYHEEKATRTDDESLDKLRGFRWSRVPVLLGTPDDIIIENGKRRIVDYKAPSADVMKNYESKGVSFDYVCQLHDYAVLSMAAGVKVDLLSVEAFDPRYFKIHRFPVDFDVELAREIAQTSTTLWNDHVMQGDVPAAPRPDELDIENPVIIELGTQAAILKVISDQLVERVKEARERISVLGSEWHDLAVGNLNLEVASLARKRTWDEEELRSLADAAGVDPADFEVNEGKLDMSIVAQMLNNLIEGDAEAVEQVVASLREDGTPFSVKLDAAALAEHLEEAGVSTIPAATLSESFSLTRKKKGPEAEKLAALRLEASDAVDMICDMAERSAPAILNPENEAVAAEAAEIENEMGM